MNPINYWHDLLGMQKYDEAWHRNDLNDELHEFYEATGLISTWSELSDVAYTYTRAKWSGHQQIIFPLSKYQLVLGLIYMIPKYTLRWRFFRQLGHQFDKNLHLSVVRNPRKSAKLANIATNYRLDPVAFEAKAQELLKRTILLP